MPACATGFGAVYTVYAVFSEWLNIVVTKRWEYSELMPVVPIIDAGLSPLLQWVILPPALLPVAKSGATAMVEGPFPWLCHKFREA